MQIENDVDLRNVDAVMGELNVKCMPLSEDESKPAYDFVKRVFDFVSAFVVGIALLIPCIVVAVIIMIADPGNPFFLHERIGKDGKTIKVAKFRSMVKNAGDIKGFLTEKEYEIYMREYKLENDPRLLPYGIGKLMRKTSIDEVPQIIYNILLKKDMSVVGPRPIVKEELDDKYTDQQKKILLSVKPGLTGYWQAYARNDVGYENNERQNMELYYVEHRGIWMDMKILFKSVITVFSGKGAQ